MRIIALFLLGIIGWGHALDLNLSGQVKSTAGDRLGGTLVTLNSEPQRVFANSTGGWILSNLSSSSSSSANLIYVPSAPGVSSFSSSSSTYEPVSSSNEGSSSEGSWEVGIHPTRPQGFAIFLNSQSGNLQLSLSSSALVTIQTFDLLGKRTILFVGQSPAGQFSLQPFSQEALRGTSGIMILQVQIGSARQSFQVVHRGNSILSVRSVDSKTSATLLSIKAGSLALAQTSLSTVDTLVFSMGGYHPFKLGIQNYLQGNVGTVFMEPIQSIQNTSVAAAIVTIQNPLLWITTTLVPSPRVLGQLYSTPQIGDGLTMCVTSKRPRVVIDSLRQNAIKGAELIASSTALCHTFLLEASNHLEAFAHELSALTTDSITLTPIFDARKVAYPPYLRVNGIASGTYLNRPLQILRSSQVQVCATPLEGYDFSTASFSSENTPRVIHSKKRSCLAFNAETDETLQMSFVLRDTLKVIMQLDPGVTATIKSAQYNAYLLSRGITGIDTLAVLRGDTLRYIFTTAAPLITNPYALGGFIFPSQDTSIHIVAQLPVHYHHVIFAPNHHLKLECDQAYQLCPDTLLIPDGAWVKVIATPSTGWKIEQATPAGILDSNFTPTQDTVVQFAMTAQNDSITLIRDPGASYSSQGFPADFTRIPRYNSSAIVVAVSKTGYSPTAVLVNAIPRDITLSSYAGKDIAQVWLPINNEINTLEIVWSPLEQPLHIQHISGWLSQGETVAITTSQGDSLTLPQDIATFGSLSIHISHPTLSVRNIRIGGVLLSAASGSGNSGSGNVPVLNRTNLGLAPSDNIAKLSYELYQPDFVILKPIGIDPDDISYSNPKTLARDTLSRCDTMWDGTLFNYVYKISRGGEYFTGYRFGTVNILNASWTPLYRSQTMSATIHIAPYGYHSGDTVEFEPLVVKTPAYVKIQDTSTAEPIKYSLIDWYLNTSLIDNVQINPGQNSGWRVYPFGVPANQAMRLWVNGVPRADYYIPSPWSTDSTIDTLQVNLIPEFRPRDSVSMTITSPQPIYQGISSNGTFGPIIPLREITSGRFREGDSLVLCYANTQGRSLQLLYPRSDNFISGRTSDSLQCLQLQSDTYPWGLAGTAHTVSLRFWIYPSANPLAQSGVARTIEIQAPLAGVTMKRNSSTKIYHDADTVQSGNDLWARTCLPSSFQDEGVYYLAQSPGVRELLTTETPCSSYESNYLYAPENFNADTLHINLTAKTRHRVSPIIDPALLPWIQNAYIQKQGSTTGLEFNTLGFVDTTLLQYDTNHTILCVTPKPEFDLLNSQIKRGLNSQWATPNPTALGWNYCTTISSEDNLDNNLENGVLVIRADSLRLHPVKIVKPALAGSSVVLRSRTKEIVQNYVGANRVYELYATYPSTHLVDSFSVGGSPIAAFTNYSTYAGSQSFYYNSTLMKPTTNDSIEVKYIYRERRKYALAIDPAFKALLDTAWISDRKSATIYPWFTVPEFTEGINLPTICMVPKLGVTVNSVLFDATLVSSYFMNISLTGIPARTICSDLGTASTLRSAAEAGTILQVKANTTGTPITP